MRNKLNAVLAGVLALLAVMFIGPQAQAVTNGWQAHKYCGYVNASKYIQDSQVKTLVETIGGTQYAQITNLAVRSSAYGYIDQVKLYYFSDNVQKDAWTSFSLHGTSYGFTLNTVKLPTAGHVLSTQVWLHTTTGNSCSAYTVL